MVNRRNDKPMLAASDGPGGHRRVPAPGLRGCLLGWHELDHRNEQYGDGDDVRNSSSTTTWTAVELFRKSITAYGPAADADVTPADVVAAYPCYTPGHRSGVGAGGLPTGHRSGQ